MIFSSLDTILDEAVRLIADSAQHDIRVIKKYPSSSKPTPLDKITVTVSFSSFKSTPVTDSSSDSVQYEAELQIGVFVPTSLSSTTGFDVIWDACTALRRSEAFSESSSVIESVAPNRVTGSFEIYANVKAVFYENPGSSDDGGGEIDTGIDVSVEVNGIELRKIKKLSMTSQRDEEFIKEYGEDGTYDTANGAEKQYIEISFCDDEALSVLSKEKSAVVTVESAGTVTAFSSCDISKIKTEISQNGERVTQMSLISAFPPSIGEVQE